MSITCHSHGLQIRIASDGWQATIDLLSVSEPPYLDGENSAGGAAAREEKGTSPQAAAVASVATCLDGEHPHKGGAAAEGETQGASLDSPQAAAAAASVAAAGRRPPLWAVAKVLRALVSVAGLGSARHRLVAESPSGGPSGGWGQGWEHELDLPEDIGER